MGVRQFLSALLLKKVNFGIFEFYYIWQLALSEPYGSFRTNQWTLNTKFYETPITLLEKKEIVSFEEERKFTERHIRNLCSDKKGFDVIS